MARPGAARRSTFHIGEAVKIAGAKRIGHGVDLAFERDLDDLFKTMRERQVAVEINLTSNDQILGVHGPHHPFPAYRAAGVPVVLSTDDAAVERIDLTNEYDRAARYYGLDYPALKRIARASLTYSFLDETESASNWTASTPPAQRSTGDRRAQILLTDLSLIVKAQLASAAPVQAAAARSGSNRIVACRQCQESCV